MTNEEIYEKRMSGATFQEIANACGVSRQAIHDRLKLYEQKVKGRRGHGFYIKAIKFEGIYQYFKENIGETVSSFCTRTGTGNKGGRVATMKNFLTGKTDSRFSIPQIKKMCEVCGKPFEEVFKERDAE